MAPAINVLLEAVVIEDLGCGVAVERGPRSRRIVEPVLSVDKIDVIAWTHDPSESELPSENTADRIVLQVTRDRDPWIELIVRVEPQNACRELPFGQLYAMPPIDPLGFISKKYPEAPSRKGSDAHRC